MARCASGPYSWRKALASSMTAAAHCCPSAAVSNAVVKDAGRDPAAVACSTAAGVGAAACDGHVGRAAAVSASTPPGASRRRFPGHWPSPPGDSIARTAPSTSLRLDMPSHSSSKRVVVSARFFFRQPYQPRSTSSSPWPAGAPHALVSTLSAPLASGIPATKTSRQVGQALCPLPPELRSEHHRQLAPGGRQLSMARRVVPQAVFSTVRLSAKRTFLLARSVGRHLPCPALSLATRHATHPMLAT